MLYKVKVLFLSIESGVSLEKKLLFAVSIGTKISEQDVFVFQTPKKK